MIIYNKLWYELERRGMKKTDLLEVISSPTLAKLGKNENVNVKVISDICDFLNCQPSDIMENITNEQMKETAQAIDKYMQVMFEQVKAKGVTEEQFTTMLSQVLNAQTKAMYNGEKITEELYDKVIAENLKPEE